MPPQQTAAREKLNRWANIGERDAPVTFVGRTHEIDLAIRQLETWRAGETQGRTLVLQGAPGAGKTALLHEIGRRLPDRLPDAVAIYRATPWNRNSAPNVLRTLAIQMMGAAPSAGRTTTGTTNSIGAKAVGAVRHDRTTSTAPPTLATWDDFETLFAPCAELARPTVLLVDEVQRVGSDDETTDLLYHLHDQNVFPLVLVCGGLSTSAARLGEVGISRLDETHIVAIDALTQEDATRCLEQSLHALADDVGGVAGHPDLWARRLAPHTHGWPQHVTCYLRSAAEALVESERLAFDDDNLPRVLACAGEHARRYYDRRLEASRTDPMIVYAVHEAISGATVRRTDAMAIIDEVVPALGEHAKQDHARYFPHAGDCLQQMLHAGVIGFETTATTSPLSVPIPSIAAHIAALLPDERREAVRRVLGYP